MTWKYSNRLPLPHWLCLLLGACMSCAVQQRALPSDKMMHALYSHLPTCTRGKKKIKWKNPVSICRCIAIAHTACMNPGQLTLFWRGSHLKLVLYAICIITTSKKKSVLCSSIFYAKKKPTIELGYSLTKNKNPLHGYFNGIQKGTKITWWMEILTSVTTHSSIWNKPQMVTIWLAC